MSNPKDLRHLINNSLTSQPPVRGSGYTVNMPDGKGGQSSVPVEIATVMMLDNLVSTMQRIEQLLAAQMPPRKESYVE